MAYSYIRSVALPRSAGAQWLTPDISSKTLSSIYATYDRVYLVLSHSALPTEVFVDMSVYSATYAASTETVVQWLANTIADNTLQYTPTLPNASLKYARYSQAIPQKYKIGIVEIDNYPGQVPNDYQPTGGDVYMYRSIPYTNMQLLQDYSLVSVNGFVHSTTCNGTTNRLTIKGGLTTAMRSRQNNVGIISFLGMGQITKMPIEITNIRPINVGEPLYDGLYFDIEVPDGFTLDNKAFMLILGGYINMVNDGSNEPSNPASAGQFWKTGANTFRVNLANMYYVERILESSAYLNLSTLGLTQDLSDPSSFDIDELRSDIVVKKYLTMSQSFLCAMSVPILTVNTITPRHSVVPGHFTSVNEPLYPMQVGYGRLAEYIKEYNDGAWAITISDPYTRNYIMNTTRPYEGGLIPSQLIPFKPYSSTSGKFLEFAGSYS